MCLSIQFSADRPIQAIGDSVRVLAASTSKLFAFQAKSFHRLSAGGRLSRTAALRNYV